MPRILIVNPTVFLGRDFIDYPYFLNHPALWAGAWAQRSGAHVTVLDAFSLPLSGRYIADGERTLLGTPSLERYLPEMPFDVVVVVSSPFLHPWAPDQETMHFIKSLRDTYKDATIVLADCHFGGMHYVDYDGNALFSIFPELDVIVKYAGEHLLAKPESLISFRGLHRVLVEPASTWSVPPPFPAWEKIDLKAFSAFLWRCFSDGTWANPFRIGPTTRPIMTSSGCPYRCVFCSSNPGADTNKHYRVVPLDVVADWALLLMRGFGAKKLFVMDDIANLRPDFEELLEVFDSLDVFYEFPNGLRADHLSEKAIHKMSKRVSLLCISAESGNEEDLMGPIGKRLRLKDIERVASIAHEARVPLLVHYVIGFPWETPAHINKTLEYAFTLYEKWGALPSVQFATPLQGTRLFRICAELGLVPQNGFFVNGASFQHSPSYQPPSLPSGFLKRAKSALERKIDAARTKKVIVNLTYECINDCIFCAVSNRVRRAIPFDRLKEILEEHRKTGVELLDLDGGEPTIYPDLLQAVSIAVSLGYRQINITTNGRRLKEKEFARKLVNSGITSIQVSVHGSCALVHETITRVGGSFAETLSGLRNVVALRPSWLDLAINLTIVRQNLHDVPNIVELACREGVDKVNIQLVTPFGRAVAGIVPSLEDVFEVVREAIDRFSDRISVQVVNGQFCMFPGYENYLMGDVGKLGRTMVFATEEEVNLFAYLASRRVRKEPCMTCPWALICEGFFEFGEEVPDVLESRRP